MQKSNYLTILKDICVNTANSALKNIMSLSSAFHNKIATNQRECIFYIRSLSYQRNGIKPTQTLEGIVHSLDNLARQSATNLISKLDMENYIDMPFYQLSAGLKRKTALIQMLAPAVDLYIADEPLNHIDQISCQVIWQIFAEKTQAGAAILMSHHGNNPFNHSSIREITLNE